MQISGLLLVLQDDDHAYVVTEVCHGGDLEQFLQVRLLAVLLLCAAVHAVLTAPTARLTDHVTCHCVYAVLTPPPCSAA